MRRIMSVAGLWVFMFISPAVLYAYDYPVIGNYNILYQKVFDSIKAGKCRGMETELKALASSEGISDNIYRSICFFENNQQKEGFLALTLMLENQEYDEIVYVCSSHIGKGDTTPELLKFRGLAYFNIGDLNGALSDITAYTDKTGDTTMRYTLVDIYMSMNRLDMAQTELEKSASKDDGYYSRKGKLMSRNGSFDEALSAFKMVSPQNSERYGQTQLLIADICMMTGKISCAQQALAKAGGNVPADEIDSKREKLEKIKKPFSIYFSFSEEFDDNVKSENEDIGASGVSSFRTAVVLDAKYNIYPLWADKIALGVMNYRSFNMKDGLSSYDLEMHRGYVQASKSLDKFSLTPKLTAGIMSLGNEKYYESFGAELTAGTKYKGFYLSMPVKFEKRNYSASVDPRADKDGYYYGISADISKPFAQKYNVSFGLGIDVENADGEDKDSTAYSVSAGVLAAVAPKVTVSLDADYTYTDFYHSAIDDMDRPGLAVIREDRTYGIGFKTIYRFTDSVFFSGGAAYTYADSNVDEYKYKKTVFDIGVSYAY